MITLSILPGAGTSCSGNDSIVIEFQSNASGAPVSLGYLNLTNDAAYYCSVAGDTSCTAAYVIAPTAATNPSTTTPWPTAAVTTGGETAAYKYSGQVIATGSTPSYYFLSLNAATGTLAFGAGYDPTVAPIASITDPSLSPATMFTISTPSGVDNGVGVTISDVSAYTTTCITQPQSAATATPITMPTNSLIGVTLMAGSGTASDLAGCNWAGSLVFQNSASSTTVFTLIFAGPTSVSVLLPATTTTPSPVPQNVSFVNNRTLPTGFSTGSPASVPVYVSLRPGNVVWVGNGSDPNVSDSFLASFSVPNASTITSVTFQGAQANSTGWYPVVTKVSTNPNSPEDILRKYWWAFALGALALVAVIAAIVIITKHDKNVGAQKSANISRSVEAQAAAAKAQQIANTAHTTVTTTTSAVPPQAVLAGPAIVA